MDKVVLVVDDDPDVCATLDFRLSSFGYTMISAKDGKEACQKAKELKPNLILLDIGLSEESGLDILKELKMNTPDMIHKIPVIMLTGKEDLEKNCLEAGAAGYITKPFDLFKLKGTLSKFLTSS